MSRKFSDIERRQRKSARIALYCSLLLTLAGGVSLSKVAREAILRAKSVIEDTQGWNEVDWEARPEVQLFQEYLRIDTNADDGSELAGAEFLASRLAEAGIPSVIERFSGEKANLWAILEGEDPRALVLHNHIDVEPIFQPEEWVHPPFSGFIEPPWIYGRGAFDMKSLAAAQLHSFLQLKKEGVPLKRSVIFLATGSEERGSDLGTRWILQNRPELVERFWAVLTEGGVVEAIDAGDVKYWGTEIGQKRFVDLIVCSQDKERLRGARDELKAWKSVSPPRIRLRWEVAALFEDYAATRGRTDFVELLSSPERMLEDPKAFALAPKYIRSMLRNEVSPFRIRESEGGGYERIFRLQLLPGEDVVEARKRLVPDWMLNGLTWTLLDRPSANEGSPMDHPLYMAIQELLGERYPAAPSGPYFLAKTATDARYFRHAGIPSYGFSPFLILTPDTLTGNHPNERVSLPGYADGVRFYTELLRRLVL